MFITNEAGRLTALTLAKPYGFEYCIVPHGESFRIELSKYGVEGTANFTESACGYVHACGLLRVQVLGIMVEEFEGASK